jgi:DNA polymerase zeta
MDFSGAAIEIARDEESLFSMLIEKVRILDPDILLGYEIHSSSWGYLFERSSKLFGKFIL